MNKQQGFSLLEILVAFSIMAVSLSIMLKIFSSGVNTAVIAEEYTIATQIAESLMAGSGVETPLMPGDRSGVEEDKYRWNVHIQNATHPLTDELEEDNLFAVKVKVEWGGEGDNNRFIELNTVKTGRRE